MPDRTRPLVRRTRLARGPMKRRNPKRRQTEFARTYGSKARVAFVRALPCCGCGRGPSDNAHLRTDGAGRKAGYEWIVPLCRPCHRAYDEHRRPWDYPAARAALYDDAVATEQAWQTFNRSQAA